MHQEYGTCVKEVLLKAGAEKSKFDDSTFFLA